MSTDWKVPVIGMLALCWLAIWWWWVQQPTSAERATQREACATQLPEPLRSRSFVRHGGTSTVRFILENRTNMALFTKLVDDEDRTVVALAVRKYDTLHTKVPPGRYHHRQALGATWCGMDETFGPQARFAETVLPIDFMEGPEEYTRVWLVWGVEDGDVRMQAIDRDAFGN